MPCWFVLTRCSRNRQNWDLAYPPEESGRTDRGSKAPNADVSIQAPTPVRVYSYSARRRCRVSIPIVDTSLMMNMESQVNWMLRPMPLAQWCMLLVLLSATVSPTPSFSQGTLAPRTACIPDAFKLCSAFIPDPDAITTCLNERNADLSDACRTAFEAALNQLPGGRDGTGARKRTTR